MKSQSKASLWGVVLCLGWLLALAPGAQGDTHTAASVAESDVQAAYNAASDETRWRSLRGRPRGRRALW